MIIGLLIGILVGVYVGVFILTVYAAKNDAEAEWDRLMSMTRHSCEQIERIGRRIETLEKQTSLPLAVIDTAPKKPEKFKSYVDEEDLG